MTDSPAGLNSKRCGYKLTGVTAASSPPSPPVGVITTPSPAPPQDLLSQLAAGTARWRWTMENT